LDRPSGSTALLPSPSRQRGVALLGRSTPSCRRRLLEVKVFFFLLLLLGCLCLSAERLKDLVLGIKTEIFLVIFFAKRNKEKDSSFA
jgi:hypothetical protein